MGIVDDIKSIIQIKIKPRQDSYSDQFSRVFLIKVMFVGALFTGMNWFDDLKCLIKNDADGAFSGSACWINGVYIYEDIRYHDNEIGYYGMPRMINFDGVKPDGTLCETATSATNLRKIIQPDCEPMKKTFFLQYQYMTFFLVFIGALYYSPYIFFKFVNSDIRSLKSTINSGNAKDIYDTFFNRKINPPSRLAYRIFGNILTKILYIIVNVVAFVLTDDTLNGNFKSYGTHYATWSKLNNSIAYNYMGKRLSPKPGDVLLPSFAFCEVDELAEDIKTVYTNKHRFICEMTQHILYQYIFLIIWWIMVFGILISVVGLIILLADYASMFIKMKQTVPGFSSMGLSIRECEYLNYLRRKKLSLYGDILGLLKNNENLDRNTDNVSPQNQKGKEKEQDY